MPIFWYYIGIWGENHRNCAISGQKFPKNPPFPPIYGNLGQKQAKNEQKQAILGDFRPFLDQFRKHLIIFGQHFVKIPQNSKTFCQNPPNFPIFARFV